MDVVGSRRIRMEACLNTEIDRPWSRRIKSAGETKGSWTRVFSEIEKGDLRMIKSKGAHRNPDVHRGECDAID